MSSQWIRISPLDNVAVALEPLAAGTDVAGVPLLSDLPAGHKAAVAAIPAGEQVIKYGYPIGQAVRDIAPGEHVHTDNTKTLLSDSQEYVREPVPVEALSTRMDGKSFLGYPRRDGRTGTRNEIWIIPTVGCVNKTAERLAAMADREFAGRCDGVYSFTHPYGCSQLGEDHEATRTILADLVRHPNAGGVLVLGLGCENNGIAGFRALLTDREPERVKFMSTQDVEDELLTAMELLDELIGPVEQDRRVPCPVSDLVVGMKCGGSDGLSGITANPLVGCFSDRIVAAGGTSILTEVPEMFGAETILMNRCVNEEVFSKTVDLVNGFKEYFLKHDQVVYENPSPGNKDGGITTLEDKSLGCIQKGGRAPVSDVIPYGGRTDRKGLVLLNGPGNDIVSTTAMTAAGATVILFTTGRGTPLGAPVPTIKVSTNSALAEKKKSWIDFNAGVLAEGADPEAVCDDFCECILDTASGEQSRNEINGYREIAIFKDGVTL